MDPGSESSGPEVSGPHTAAPMQQPLPLTGVDSPRFTGRNVLSLTTEDFTGPLLLRGYSLIDYTGSAWEPADDVQSNFPPNTIQTYTGSALRYLPDSVLHTMTVRPMYAADRKSIVYTPYFYAGVEASDPTFSGDSALYAMTSRSALYTFYTPGAGYIDNPPHIIASMSPYDDEALDRYRSVDGGVAALLLDYFADGIAALEALPSESARIEALAELVRECAAYNANVGAYPQDVDFVRYFLTESGEGRCVHFATTATLLYRSLGYPARFVSGYSAVVEKTTTLVPDYAAHAWTEIWIDGLGWIPVDVTPAEYRGAGFGDVSQTESAQTSAGAESGASSAASSSSSAESDTSTSASNASSGRIRTDVRRKRRFRIGGRRSAAFLGGNRRLEARADGCRRARSTPALFPAAPRSGGRPPQKSVQPARHRPRRHLRLAVHLLAGRVRTDGRRGRVRTRSEGRVQPQRAHRRRGGACGRLRPYERRTDRRLARIFRKTGISLCKSSILTRQCLHFAYIFCHYKP